MTSVSFVGTKSTDKNITIENLDLILRQGEDLEEEETQGLFGEKDWWTGEQGRIEAIWLSHIWTTAVPMML